MKFQLLFALLQLTIAASQECVDSTLKGNIVKGNVDYHTCAQIVKKKLCNKTGAKQHCPSSCEDCDASKCVDATKKFEYKKKGTQTNNCKWVAKNTNSRCKIKGVTETCRASCEYCSDTEPPTKVPTAAPTAIPTAAPTAKPTPVPTAAPTSDPSSTPSSSPSTSQAPSEFCDDSELKLRTVDVDGVNSEFKCSQIGKGALTDACKYPGVKSHCPKTCDGCDVCVNSSLEFKVKKDYLTCATANCATSLVFHTCRANCGTCVTDVPSSSPSALPSLTPTMTPTFEPTDTPTSPPTSGTECVDSTLKGNIVKGNVTYHTCAQIVKKKLCNKTGAKQHCPLSCEDCDASKCVDATKKFEYKKKGTQTNNCNWVAKNTKSRCKIKGVTETCRASCEYCL